MPRTEIKQQLLFICHFLCMYYSTTGLHTIVLHMRSPNLFFSVEECSDYMNNFILPPALFNLTTYGYEMNAFWRNITCERFDIHYYIHIHINETTESEEELLRFVESSVMSSNESENAFLTFLKQNQIDKSNLSFRSTVACFQEIVIVHDYRTTWPTTLIGQTALPEEICVGDKGEVIERKCLGDSVTGAFWGQIVGKCIEVSSIFTVNLYELSKENITNENILNSSLNLETWTTTRENMSSADVQFVAQILRNMAVLPDISPEAFRSIFNSVDHVIGEEHLKDKNSISNASSSISFALRSMLLNLGLNGEVLKASGSSIAVLIFPFGGNTTLIQSGGILENWNSNMTTLFNGTGKEEFYTAFEEFEAGILLPMNLVSDIRSQEVAIVIHKNIHHVENIEVVSPVIGVSVGSMPVYDVDPPIEMIFNVSKREEVDSLQCVFWDQKQNDNYGGWSKQGCHSRHLTGTHISCSCDHLASFTVILEPRFSHNKPKVPKVIFSRSIYIGCCFSMVGLLTIILTFLLFRQYRRDLKHKVLFNLSIALFVYMFTIPVGLEQRENDVIGCWVVAVILHYCMLASYSWMLIEAFIQYHTLVKVIGTYIPRFMQKAAIFGWGIPFLFVVIVLIIDYDAYVSKNKFCWFSRSNKVYYYGVTGPVTTMLTLTFLVFALILYATTCGRNKLILRTNQNKRKAQVARLRALFCVAMLLVLSWIHGVINVFGRQIFFQYLFAFMLTLQGIFIFVHFVFVSESTRKLWFSLFTNTPLTPTPKVSTIEVSTSSARPSTHSCNNSHCNTAYNSHSSNISGSPTDVIC